MAANSQELKYVFIMMKLSVLLKDSFRLFLSSPLLPSEVNALPSVLTFFPPVPLCFHVAPCYARSLCAWFFFFCLIYFFPFALHITSPLAIWTASLANWHKPLGSARSLCCKKHLVSVSQPAGAQHLVVMDLDMWLGTMLRTEGSGEEQGGGRGKERGSEGKKTFVATEHETHLSDAWHSDRWWKSHFMLQTWCTFEILVLIDLLGCLSHPTCHDDNVMCEPRPWGFDE